jgi:hypothetical protein
MNMNSFETLLLKMLTTVFAETLENTENPRRVILRSQSYTVTQACMQCFCSAGIAWNGCTVSADFAVSFSTAYVHLSGLCSEVPPF